MIENGIQFENLEHLDEQLEQARLYMDYHISQVNTHARMAAFWTQRVTAIEDLLSPIVEIEEIARAASETLD